MRGASDGVGKIIKRPRRVIDAVMAAAGHLAFQTHDLPHQAIMARQHNALGIQHRQQGGILIRLRPLDGLVNQVVLAEQLGRKAVAEAITVDSADIVRYRFLPFIPARDTLTAHWGERPLLAPLTEVANT
jgi:hypothetical protein